MSSNIDYATIFEYLKYEQYDDYEEAYKDIAFFPPR